MSLVEGTTLLFSLSAWSQNFSSLARPVSSEDSSSDAPLESVPANAIVAGVRDPAKNEGAVKALRDNGIEVRAADYTQPATLASAFAGVDRLLLISMASAVCSTAMSSMRTSASISGAVTRTSRN